MAIAFGAIPKEVGVRKLIALIACLDWRSEWGGLFHKELCGHRIKN